MARLVDDELWIVCPQLTADEAGVLVLDAETGALRATLRLPQLGRILIAVDSVRRRLYMAAPNDGTVAVAALPDWDDIGTEAVR